MLALGFAQGFVGQHERLSVPADAGDASRPLRWPAHADVLVQPVAGAAAGCNLQPHAQQPPAVLFAAPSQHLHRHRPLVHGPVSVRESQQAAPVLAVGVAGYRANLKAGAHELPFALAVIIFQPILDGAVRQPKGRGYAVLWRGFLSVAVCVDLAFSCERGIQQVSESLRSPAVRQRIGQVPFRREVGGHSDDPHVGGSCLAGESYNSHRVLSARLIMVGPNDHFPALQRGPVGLVWRLRPMRRRRCHHIRKQLGRRLTWSSRPPPPAREHPVPPKCREARTADAVPGSRPHAKRGGHRPGHRTSRAE